VDFESILSHLDALELANLILFLFEPTEACRNVRRDDDYCELIIQPMGTGEISTIF